MGRLSLSLLGPLKITLDGQPVDGFAYNKARALLVYLMVEAGRAHTREALVGLLWPELPDSAARTNLRQALANLREVIGDAQANPPLLLITRDTIQLNPASDHELDLPIFTRLLASCATHAHRHRARCRSCAERMEQALALYRGDFLIEFSPGDSAAFEEWQLRQRERLALPGEWLFDLAELSYPASDSINNIKDYSAVQLFMQRARQLRRQFILTDADSHAVSRICRLVEGLPLAIELAAAALHGRSCIAIADAIEASVSTLTIELRAVPQRQHSIWATFEHSWRLLTDQERRVFTQLSVFRGGFDAIAATHVAQASLQLLVALANKSLLRRDGVSRFDMHELVRQYASEKLAMAGDTQVTRRKHAAYFLALIQAHASKLRGPEQTVWLARFDLERDNLRAALQWALDCSEAEMGLQLAGNLFWFWYTRSDYSEGQAWLEQLLARSQSADVNAATRIKALNATGALMRKQDNYLEAAAQIEASLSLAREVGNIDGIAWSLHLHGLIAHDQGHYTQAIAYSEESLGLYQQISGQWGIAASLWNLGRIMQRQGKYTQAMAYYNQSLIVWQAAGDIRGIAFALLEQGKMAKDHGTYDQASDLFGRSLLLFRELGDKWGIAKALLALGQIAQQQGDNSQAKVYYTESLALFQGLGLNTGSAACREGLAAMAVGQSHPERPTGDR